MTARKSLTKKTRFEVFKRDGFKCVYCGACAPEAVLVVDHIDPLAKGGANEIVNYATACQPCNAGKSDRKLDDNAVLLKQRRQLDELNERREQLEMMLEWRNGLKDEKEYEATVISDAWSTIAPGWHLNDSGKKEAVAHIKKYGLAAVLDAVDVAGASYVKLDDIGMATYESQSIGWAKLGGILALQHMLPDQRRLYYVQGILRKRLSYVPPYAIDVMRRVLAAGISVDSIEREAKTTYSWADFSDWLNSWND